MPTGRCAITTGASVDLGRCVILPPKRGWHGVSGQSAGRYQDCSSVGSPMPSAIADRMSRSRRDIVRVPPAQRPDTAFAIPDAVSEHAVSKMTDQARVRWPGRSRIGILLQPAAPMGISNLSCFLRTVERGECDADHTIEQSALGAYTGQDAHAHQNAKQMLRQADCRSGRRNSPIGLTLFHAGQEE